MEDVNPYAAPRHDLPLDALADEPGDSVWRDGDLLVMRKGAVLPDRCVKCNAPAEGRRLRTVQLWHDPIYFLLLLLPLAPIIVLFDIHWHWAEIDLGICGLHHRQHNVAIFVSGLSFVSGIASIVAALAGDALPIAAHWRVPSLLAAGVALLAVSIRATISSDLASPHKIDRDYVWLKKVDPGYLAQFPPFAAFAPGRCGEGASGVRAVGPDSSSAHSAAEMTRLDLSRKPAAR